MTTVLDEPADVFKLVGQPAGTDRVDRTHPAAGGPVRRSRQCAAGCVGVPHERGGVQTWVAPSRASSDQALSSAGKSTSAVSNCTAAATGIATSAPTIPSSAAPIMTATTVTPAGTCTARPMTLGTKR
jgi:hypothetical protein